ncbi:MAG: GH32 C-terminal domain-containing protein [Bacteroidales bacterium]
MTRILTFILLFASFASVSKSQETQERYRPAFHYSPEKNRMGKLSGLIKLDDTYHLYFQKNDNNLEDAYYSLAQITSKDLLNWSEEEIVVKSKYMQKKQDGTIYPGSAIIDVNKLSAVSSGASSILLYYTRIGEGVCMSYSNDAGKTWQEYSENPILAERSDEKIERPYVFFDESRNKWYMSLSLVEKGSEKRSIEILSTDNLTDFTSLSKSDLACDNATLLPYNKSDNSTAWIVINNNGSYQAIDFDGKSLSEAGALKWSDNGRTSSSPVFCKLGNVYKSIALMDENFPEMPFRGQSSLPADVTVMDKGGDVVMMQRPMEELSAIMQKSKEIKNKLIMPGGKNPFAGVSGIKLRIKGTVEMRSCNYFTLYTRVHRGSSAAQVMYESEDGKLVSAGNSAAYPLPGNKIVDFDIIIDKTSMEVFANGGEAVVKSLVFSSEAKAVDFVVSVKGGEAYIKSLIITEIE